MSPRTLLVTLLSVFLFASQCHAFFLSYVAFVSSVKFNQLTGYSFPALYTREYYNDFDIPLFEKRASPFGTDYNFCPSACENEQKLQNMFDELLWELIRVPYDSYKITVPKVQTCKLLCDKTFIGGNPDDEKKLDLIRSGKPYRHWVIDGIPVLFCVKKNDGTQRCYTKFPTSCFSSFCPDHICFQHKQYYPGIIFNHVDLDIFYENNDDSDFAPRKIVYAQVTPRSYNHTDPTLCTDDQPLVLPESGIEKGERFNVHYTYSVRFIRSYTLKYESRWKHILDSLVFCDLHWIELVYATLMVLIVLMTMIIILKSVYRNVLFYQKTDCSENIDEGYRWKLVSQIYIPPYVSMMLSVLLGTFIQLTSMAVLLLVFSLIAFQVTEGRDVQMIWAMITFTVLGLVGGYASSSLYKTFKGDRWITSLLVTAIFCSGVTISVFAVFDFLLMYVDGTATLPLYTLGGFLCAWFPCFVFFNIIGSIFAFREEMKQSRTTLKKYARKANEIFYRTFISRCFGRKATNYPDVME